jgi:glycerol-3-phosphate cytidylyltransferase|tara:strand:- start:1557 stop:1979 length:423 start_codon:yes stop_codon:yes gene_type:complete
MSTINKPKYELGVIAGNFDVIHPGYIKMFQECKEYCDRFLVLLHSDPSIERPEKLKPILSVGERIEMLLSIKYINAVETYTYESELYKLLEKHNPNIRFLGDDYKGRTYTGFELNIPIHYLNRDHGWSTTKFKKLIADTI